MFSHLLIPLDGSEMAETALESAKALAEKFQSRLTLLRVVDVPQAGRPSEAGSHDTLLDDIRRNHFSDATTYIKAKQAELASQGFNVHTQLIESEAVAMAILEIVTRLDITAVVMSTHGRGGLNRLIFGSVAEKVLRQCPVPMVVMRSDINT